MVGPSFQSPSSQSQTLCQLVLMSWRLTLPLGGASVSDGVWAMALNHGITSTDALSAETPYGGGEFISRFVFPGRELPHLGFVLQAMQEGGLEAIDIENLRRHYERTLSIWLENFERRCDVIRPLVGEEKFRIWRMYLAGCAHAFRHDAVSIFQILCHKAGQRSDTLNWSRNYMYRSGK
ncbi:MAG: class I SAM-dependent methyltransferase [Burkholderiales bacterium]|nr:class I SAM-dependent methyltransferase [Burkholderiales bacterium]